MAVLTLAALLCFTATFQQIASHKIIAYWGQNGVYASHPQRKFWEKDLIEFCQNYNYDTVVLSFLHVFFDTQNKDHMPGMNFAFHCEKGVSEEYPSLLRCPKIEAGIKECQKRGKTVLMSLGGASGAAGFQNDAQGKLLAYRIYHLLLEGEDLTHIRPFGSAVLNGVDLDIEGGSGTGYTAFVTELRRLEKAGKQKLTISAAPQCPFPDAIQGPAPGKFLGDVPEMIDEIYIQFYNNWCQLGNKNAFWESFNQWVSYSKKNNGPRVFIGVPAATRAANIGYIPPEAVKEIYMKVKNEPRLGGIMMWDASFDQNNMIGGKHFSEHVGDFIDHRHNPTVRPVTVTQRKKTTQHKGPTTAPTPSTAPPPTTAPPTQPHWEDCKGLDDGLYPCRDCRKYISCVGGKTFHFQCANGLFFNPKIHSCDWPDHVDCKMPKY